MRDDGGYEIPDDDDMDGVLIEDETGLEASAPEEVVFEIGLSDAGSATELARQASELGYEVEMRAPDDGEAFYEVTCSRTMPAGPADIARARRELEALAEELGCLDIDAEMDAERRS
jgi:hypothetical protein